MDKLAGAEPQKRARRGRRAVRIPSGRAKQTVEFRPDEGRSRRGDDVRERVILAALECFSAFGFDGSTTRAIADRAGVTHSLVLYHFASKDRLWTAAMEDAVGTYARSVQALFAQDPHASAASKLRGFIEHFVRFSARFPQVHRILTMESTQTSERLVLLVDRHIRSHFEEIRAVIRQGQADGSVREGDAARLYYCIIGAAGTPFTVANEYRMLTGRDVFSEAEIHHTIGLIFELVFSPN